MRTLSYQQLDKTKKSYVSLSIRTVLTALILILSAYSLCAYSPYGVKGRLTTKKSISSSRSRKTSESDYKAYTKLGSLFGIRLGMSISDIPSARTSNGYYTKEFTPAKTFLTFDKYFVEFTPITRRVSKIYATSKLMDNDDAIKSASMKFGEPKSCSDMYARWEATANDDTRTIVISPLVGLNDAGTRVNKFKGMMISLSSTKADKDRKQEIDNLSTQRSQNATDAL